MRCIGTVSSTLERLQRPIEHPSSQIALDPAVLQGVAGAYCPCSMAIEERVVNDGRMVLSLFI
jgi:hypothetical protein